MSVITKLRFPISGGVMWAELYVIFDEYVGGFDVKIMINDNRVKGNLCVCML